MVQKVAKFEKISLEQWHKDYGDDTNNESDKIYNEVIKLPQRATSGSAGYDIITPFNIKLNPGESQTIPTGLKCRIDNGWFLGAFPKSGLGFKFKARLANTIGVIDEDYFNNENNEGHIFVKLCNEGDKIIEIEAGKGICQGIFIPYGITEDDDEDTKQVRNGGFGSTNS